MRPWGIALVNMALLGASLSTSAAKLSVKNQTNNTEQLIAVHVMNSESSPACNSTSIYGTSSYAFNTDSSNWQCSKKGIVKVILQAGGVPILPPAAIACYWDVSMKGEINAYLNPQYEVVVANSTIPCVNNVK